MSEITTVDFCRFLELIQAAQQAGARPCPACGVRCPANARYCDVCGAQLLGEVRDGE